MNQKHYLLKGTFILTLTGLLTRAAGFLYKIFLSRAIGASEIGLFQLTLPVSAFCMALSCGGIQTAVSRFTAEYYARKDHRAALRILACALLLSGGASLACTAAMFFGAPWIARSFLLEPACAPLLRMTALSIPFSVIHGCIGGYFIGRKNVSVTAGAQLTEQLLRIASVLFLFVLFQKSGKPMDASVMALGQIAGELFAAIFCIYHLFLGKNAPQKGRKGQNLKVRVRRDDIRRTLSVSMPLGLNRMLMCVLQGIEAALLPQMLQRSGCGSAQALAIYGTLTGMSLPLIMFPTAITAALGTLLLPAVSEAHTLHQDKRIAGTVDAGFQGSLLLGLYFLCAFLLFGGSVGDLLFHSQMAGIFTRKLALLCPFLYINTTLVNILHGLGATTLVTIWNVVGFGIRLVAIVLFVPISGIDGYFVGTLLSQAFLTSCSLLALHRRSSFRTDLMDAFVKPALVCMVSGTVSFLFKNALPYLGRTSWGALLCLAGIYTIAFLVTAFFSLPQKNMRRKILSHSIKI